MSQHDRSSDNPFTPQHTPGHIDCPACEHIRATMLCSFSADLGFREAARRWLEARSIEDQPFIAGRTRGRYIRENTHDSYRHYIDSLGLFFGDMPLNKIHVGHLAQYQRARLAGADPFIRYRRPQDAKPHTLSDGSVVPPKGKSPCPAKPKKINQELGLLKRLMMLGNAWSGEMEKLYEPLLEEEEEFIPRALSPQEQRHWLTVAKSNSRWHLVLWYSMLAFGTCLSTDEERAIRLGDINVFQGVLVVPRGKVRQRSRTIELVGADVLWALDQLQSRAAELGAKEPGHFLFPWRDAPERWDPTKPMSESGIKKCWEEVRAASGLKWFRQYDTRHTAITRLAEAGVPIDVIMSRAGHVSLKMQKHYTHISRMAQRQWIEHAYSSGFSPQPAFSRAAPVAQIDTHHGYQRY